MPDPYTDLEINCRASSRSSRPAGTATPSAQSCSRARGRSTAGRTTCRSTSATRSRPVDVNGINKMAGEWYHLLYNHVYGMRTCASAPDEHLRPAHARQGRAPDLPRASGSGSPASRASRSTSSATVSQLRDFTYVDDAVDGLPARGGTRRGARARSSTSAATSTSASRELGRAARRARRERRVRERSRSRQIARRSTSATTTPTTTRSSAPLGWRPSVELA